MNCSSLKRAQRARFKNIIAKFPRVRVLVVGDLILDEYIWGKVERISPEAPVPVVWAAKHTYVPGGAANVAYNIRALDGLCTLTGIIGSDHNKQILIGELKKRHIDSRGLCQVANRHTTLKTRIIAGHQQVVRVDWEHTEPLSPELNARVFNFIKKNISAIDAIIIEDYGKGMVNPQMLSGLILLAHSYKKIVTIDPKEENFRYYRGVTSMTPNRKELENAVRDLKLSDRKNAFRIHQDKFFSDRDIDRAGQEVMSYLGLESLLVTLGEQGMKLFEKASPPIHIPTVAQEVFDVSGAGDTVIATFTLALAAGATKLEAAHIANIAAGIVVGKIGTAVTSRKEVVQKLEALVR